MYRILIVEDNQTNSRSLDSHLGRRDNQVACVEDYKNVID